MMNGINIFTLELTCNFSGAVIYTLTFSSVYLQKSATQYLEFSMLLHDVISVKMMQ